MATIQKQQESAGKSREALEKEREKALREKQKAEDEKRRKEEAALIKPVQTQKIPFGVDPKTVLCAFFKAGNCEKGNKCKFSHNLDVERKVEKRNLYDDTREQDKSSVSCTHRPVVQETHRQFIADTMENWDEEKLRNVVLSKHGNPRTTTDVCLIHPSSHSWPAHLMIPVDCMQILHRCYRVAEVRTLVAFAPSSVYVSMLDSGGSGNARTGVKSVNTGTLSQQDSFSNLNVRLWKTLRKPTQSVWKSSWKLRYALSHLS